MGSTAAEAPGSEDEFTVLITGFGPFKEQYPINPSWEIASRLPEYLPLKAEPLAQPSSRPGAQSWSPSSSPTSPQSLGDKSSTDDGQSPTGDVDTPITPYTPVSEAGLPPVRLLVHPEAIRVNYMVVRDIIPRLWDLDGTTPAPPGQPRRRIDLAVHIGMAYPRIVYSIERLARRDGYYMRDVDGEYLGDGPRHEREGADWIWHGLPEVLATDVDVEDVLTRWKAHCPADAPTLRTSEEAGRYMCEFTFYSSMAHLEKAGLPRKVVFLHVPAGSSEDLVQNGVKILQGLVRSLVESELDSRRKAKEAGKAE